MRCDLTVVTPTNPIKSYETDSRGHIALYSKFFRIIELASDFLEMVAPNPGHPCVIHSRVLRTLLAPARAQKSGTVDTGPLQFPSSTPGRPNQQIQQQQPRDTSSPMHPAQLMHPHQQQQPHQQMHMPHDTSSSLPQHQQQKHGTPRYPHALLGQPTLNHFPNSPAAIAEYSMNAGQPNSSDSSRNPSPVGRGSGGSAGGSGGGGGGVGQNMMLPEAGLAQQQQQQPQMLPGDGGHQSLNEMLTGIGQPGNPLVSSFLGGDEWSVLMNSLGIQQMQPQ